VKRLWPVAAVLAAALAAAFAAGAFRARSPAREELTRAAEVGRPPRIHPDYTGLVIPPNIAPLNFAVREPGTLFYARLHAAKGAPVEVTSRTPEIRIPLRAWRRLLEENAGDALLLDLYVKGTDGRWARFETVTNRIAVEPIDPYLVYRNMDSLFTMWVRMSIRQRCLEDFRESLVVDSKSLDIGCINCHTFYGRRPDRWLIHMRHSPELYGSGMVVVDRDRVLKIDTRTARSLSYAAFTSWHPSGRAVAYSMNRVTQFFSGSAAEVREVCDLDSDLAVYRFDTRQVVAPPAIADPSVAESWPEWSPDGRYLYFCSAPITWQDRYSTPPPGYEQIKYALRRISYDIDTGTWGEPETVLSPRQTGQSITQPKISPDGRWLLFCMSDYSTFPSFRPSSDLYIMDLQSRRYWRLGCNSDQAESWHCWSSNGRWIVFSSKRDDTMFIRPYFSHVDERGHTSKPFVMPQRDPTFYDSFVQIYQVPEFVTGPLSVRGERLARAMRSRTWLRAGKPVTGATPVAPGSPEAQPGTRRFQSVGRE